MFLPSSTSVKNKTTLNIVSTVSDIQSSYGILSPEIFQNPGTEYRGVTLWLFNDRLEIYYFCRTIMTG